MDKIRNLLPSRYPDLWHKLAEDGDAADKDILNLYPKDLPQDEELIAPLELSRKLARFNLALQGIYSVYNHFFWQLAF